MSGPLPTACLLSLGKFPASTSQTTTNIWHGSTRPSRRQDAPLDVTAHRFWIAATKPAPDQR
jgi:hypothetical protein